MMTSPMTTVSVSKDRTASDLTGRQRLVRIALALGTALTPVALAAQNLPTGGTVVQGSASINAPSANALTINQSSDRAVVNWDGFSIGAGNRVDINQPSSDAAILNRVTGNTTSQIHGQLNANGRVFVVNPNGIFIGPSGSVNTGSFVASTLGIRTDDFVTGTTVFEGDGASATVENAGTIQVVTGGYAALIGGKVKNSGTIQAPLGFVGLGSGERVTLDLAGDGFLQVAVPTDSDDDGLDALIENSGTIQANGGTVQISAATARNAARHAINMDGVVEARTVSGRNGRITLGGGAGGKVTVRGKVRTKATRPTIQVTQSTRPASRPERGGDITITGQEITLAGADIDASGLDGGGSIRIGGEYKGGPGLPTAATLQADAATTLKADAVETGNGGRIIVWSDLDTTFAGNISARGGDTSGDGGFVEVSGKERLTYRGLTDLRAPNGATGDLLLDPSDVEIVAASPGQNQILNTDLQLALTMGNVTVSTGGTGTLPNPFTDLSEGGTITVEAPVSWASANSLTLSADEDIIVDAAITGSGAPLVSLQADRDIVINAPITLAVGELDVVSFGAPVTTGPLGDIDVATFVLGAGDWLQNDANLPDFDAGNFAIVGDGSFFLRATGGDGLPTTPFLITDVFGLQGIGTLTDANSFQLANDIDASGTSNWQDVVPPDSGIPNEGFVPLNFDGILNGDGFTISDLFVERLPANSGLGRAGLFDTVTGSVANLRLEDANVSGSTVGILAAENLGSAFAISATGTVTVFNIPGNPSFGGGLFGVNNDNIAGLRTDVTISDEFDPTTDGAPSAGESIFIGGIAGVNDANITAARTSGNISYDNAIVGFIGGIVGDNENDINDSYSTATVSANTLNGSSAHVGSITGRNLGVITNVIANGPVSLTGGNMSGGVGGVTGTDDPFDQSILSSFFSVAGTGQTVSGENGENTGTTGMLGDPFEGAIPDEEVMPGDAFVSLTDTELFVVLAGVAGWDFTNIWAFPDDGVDQARLFAVDPVITAFDAVTPEPSVEYQGSSLNFSAITPQINGGPDRFFFGPRNDTGDTGVLADQVILSGTNAGPQTYRFPTSFTSDLGQTYSVRSAIDHPLTITPAPLTVTVNNANKEFGTEFTFDQVSLSTTTLFDSDAITDGIVISDGAPADATAGTFDLSVSNLSGPGLGNYEILLIPGSLTVQGIPLDINIDDATKTYGEELLFDGTEFTVFGLLEGDTLTSLTITSDGAAATAQVADSPFLINGSDPVGTGLENYAIQIIPGMLTVVPAPLVITADDQERPFATEFTFVGDEFTVTGLLNDDTVESATIISEGANIDAPLTGAEGEIIFISDPQGTGLDNYEITLVGGIFIVAPANLTITANDQTKTYGQEFVFDGTEFTVEGLAEGDSVDSVTLASAGTAVTAQVADGPFAITASDAVGTGLENYVLSFADGSFTVVQAPLTITANDQTKQQGQEFTFAGTEFSVVGLLNDDTVDTVVLTSDGAAAEAQADDSPFDILVGDATGTGISNYQITPVIGAFTVDNLILPPQVNPVAGGNSTISNPSDSISIAFPGDGAVGSIQGSGGPQQSLPNAETTLAVVDTLSTDLETAIQSCGSADQDFTNYMACLSESLDTYSNALDQISDNLPSGLETVSATIRTARDEINAAAARAQRRLATASTDAERRAIRSDALTEARGAIDTAQSEIRKAIGLIRADDPEVAAVQRQTGARIIQAFDTVDSSLARAVEL